MASHWVRIQAAGPGASARVDCEIPVLGPDETLSMKIANVRAPAPSFGLSPLRVEMDGRGIVARDLATDASDGSIIVSSGPSTVSIDVRTPEARARAGDGASVTMYFEKSTP